MKLRMLKYEAKPLEKPHAFIVRLDGSLLETLRASAQENCRSINQEIHFRLRRDLKSQSAHPIPMENKP